ncbi:MAG: VPA1262 family protein [Sutterella wadsworthensis]|uniref:VPA1262 family protein n=1 Tax=Sutterella wadsworthensis TaxID=40545 RepID=UPI0039960EAD
MHSNNKNINMKSNILSEINNIADDHRFHRIFSQVNDNACVLQLWIALIHNGPITEKKIIYGRLLPYRHSDMTWHLIEVKEKFHIKIIQAQLFLSSKYCHELLQMFVQGNAITSINIKMGINDKDVNSKIGDISLDPNKLTFRTASCLFNRDDLYIHQLYLSPHNTTGACSASISQIDKANIFYINNKYSLSVTKFIVDIMNKETGLNFNNIDHWRFGDIELLSFPALNELEQNLLEVEWRDENERLFIAFNSEQILDFKYFFFYLKTFIGDSIATAELVSAIPNNQGIFEYTFQISNTIKDEICAIELEIFGSVLDEFKSLTLCYQWRQSYISSIQLQLNMLKNECESIRFDWLENTLGNNINKKLSSRQIPNRKKITNTNFIRKNNVLNWFDGNHQFKLFFDLINPDNSKGRFFLRWKNEDQTSRLKFVSWFKSLLGQYDGKQIIIFDPYFSADALTLLLLSATLKSRYIVFTSVPKDFNKEADQKNRITKILEECEKNDLIENTKISIFGLMQGVLHDRYILIFDQANLPLAGFHLSNSLQKEAENYPLLITPIPLDILYELNEYQQKLIKKYSNNEPESDSVNNKFHILFDYENIPREGKEANNNLNTLNILYAPEAPEVISTWFKDITFLVNDRSILKKLLEDKNLVCNNELKFPNGIRNCITPEIIANYNYSRFWEVLSEIIAHTNNKYIYCIEESDVVFICFLKNYLISSINSNAIINSTNPIYRIAENLLIDSFKSLLNKQLNISRIMGSTKLSGISYANYYAVKILWQYAPDDLLKIFELQIEDLKYHKSNNQVNRLIILNQILKTIVTHVYYGHGLTLLSKLIHSNNNFIKYVSLLIMEQKSYSAEQILEVMDHLDSEEYIFLLCWLIKRTAQAKDQEKVISYNKSMDIFHEKLPVKLSPEYFKKIVLALTNRYEGLATENEWLLKDVVEPIIMKDKSLINCACEIWIDELNKLLRSDQFIQFRMTHEGCLTNIAAYLCAQCDPEVIELYLTCMKDIIRCNEKIIYRPLASTVNWKIWDDSLFTSLWIYAFCLRCEYYYSILDINSYKSSLSKIKTTAYKLAMQRSIKDWKRSQISKGHELLDFINVIYSEPISHKNKEALS